jgi:MFS family permease
MPALLGNILSGYLLR